MLLGDRGSRSRCLLVWMSGTSSLGTATSLLHTTWRRAWADRGSFGSLPLDRVLSEIAAGVLLGCLAWGWLVLTATVAEAWRGAPPLPRRAWQPNCVRRAVLAACGVALISTGASPALAAGAAGHRDRPTRLHGAALLTGLPLPERSAAPRSTPHRPPDSNVIVVRPGDSLWAIARRAPARCLRRGRHRPLARDLHRQPPGHRPRPRPGPARPAPPPPAKGPVMTAASPPRHDGADVLELPRTPVIPVASVQGTLALELGPRLEVPDTDVPSHRGGVGADVVGVDLVRRRRFEQHAARIGAAVVEIVGGDRPVSQVLRWTTPEVYQDLARRAHLVAAAVGRRPGAGGIQSVRPHLVAAHTSFVSERCAEVSLHVRYGERSRAVAARFELIRDRWQVTALEFA